MAEIKKINATVDLVSTGVTLKLNGGTILSDDGTSHYVHSGSNLYLYSGGSATMTLAAGGNVGIGTTSPSAKLTVAGLYTTEFTGNDVIFNRDGTSYLKNKNANGSLSIQTAGSNAIVVDSSQNIQFSQYTAGLLKTDANGNVSLDTSTYLTSYTETDTLDSVTGRGATTTNAISVGEITGSKSVNGDVNFRFKNTSTGANSAGNVWIYGEAFSTIRFTKTSTSSQRGTIVYDFENEAMGFRTNGVSNRLYINSSGYVGIGTTSPSEALHIYSNAASAEIRLQNNTISSYIRSSTDNLNFYVSNGEKMRITSGGSVLINTTVEQYASTGRGVLEINGDTGATKGSLLGLKVNNTHGGYILVDSTQMQVYNHLATPLKFFTNANERMRITGSGNVCIGTTSPILNGVLTVVQQNSAGLGSTDLTLNHYYAGTKYIDFGWYGSSIGNISNEGGTRISINSSNGLLLNPSSGNVGIGTTSPGAKLTVAGAGGSTKGTDGYLVHIGGTDSSVDPVRYMIGFSHGDTYTAGNVRAAIGSLITTGGKGNLVFETGASGAGQIERMRINGDGNVGIGTTSPAQKLHVDGTTISTNGFSSDGTARMYAWRAVNNTGNNNDRYVKIARISSAQSCRFSIELAGRRTSYSDGSIPAYGKIVGQLNNDNNFDIVFYDFENEVVSVVEEVGQVDISTTETDIYVKVDGYAEISATAHISMGSITVASTVYSTEPTGYTLVNARYYMLHTANADDRYVNVTGDTMSGNLTINSGDNGYLTIMNGTQDVAWLGDFGGGTDGQLVLFNNSGTSTVAINGEANSYINGGNLGVGITSPDYKLDVAGDIRINAGNAFTDLNIKSDRTSGNIGGVNFVDGNDAIKGQVYGNADGSVKITSGGTSVAMAVSPTGMIGIGTTNPLYSLELRNAYSGGNVIMGYYDTSNIKKGFIGVVGTAGDFIDDSAVGDFFVRAQQKLHLSSGIAGDHQITVDTDGSVQFSAYGAGFLKTDANGLVSVDTASYTEAQTLDDVTDLGNSTTNGIEVGALDVDGRFVVDSKTMTMTDSFSDALTVVMGNHTGCYVKITAFGDWGSHSSISYLGEFFLNNGAGSYNEPGMIIRQVDGTDSDAIQAQIVDPGGTSGNRNFTIQLKATDTASFTAYITYTIQGMFVSAS